ncbi:MAG: GreA/GreB family elongation factor [Bacteroidetes bacterium]|nr:GreA/GreB family elongation factor [Bacteroidota bacterium]
MSNSDKIALHQTCQNLLTDKINTLNRNIKDAQQAASEDTKSSAGDKFETSREMIKQEIDKQVGLLGKTEKMLSLLTQINPESKPDQVGLGSLVKTNEGMYFFSVSLGKVSVEGKPYFVISLASPIGKELFGKRVGDKLEFMGREILVKGIW